jgi:ERF superfamily
MPDTTLPVAVTTMPSAMTSLMQLLQQVMTNPDFPIDAMERMTSLGMGLLKEQQRIAFWDAIAAIQAELQPVFRSKKNVHLGNTYASLDDIMVMLQPILNRHGVAIVFGEEAGAPEGYSRYTITVAKGGFSYTTTKDMVTDVTGARGGATQMTKQQMGKAVQTYARRTMITGFFNITTTDDDLDGEESRETGTTTQDKPQDDATASQRGWRGKNVAHWAETLCQRLAAAQSLEGIDALMNTPPVSEWLADQAGGPTKEERTKISVARMDATKRVVGAAPSPPAPDVASEPAQPSEAAQKLLAVIASCQTKVALDSLLTAPEFSRPVSALPIAEGDMVNEALKKRYTEVPQA